MQNNLVRKSVVFGLALVMVAVMFAPVTMNVSATCPGAGSTETVANVDRIENATPIIAKEGTFNIGQGEIQYENGKPVIRLFSTTWCPHCTWITDIFDNVIKEYVQTGQIVAYHWDLDSGDNILTDDVETGVPQSELAVFQTFNPGGSIPTFVFGNKYWRIGNGYEGQNDLIAEEAEFRRIIEKLVQNEESTFDEREEVITFRIDGVSNGDHSSVTPEDECEYEWDGLLMDSPSDSNITALSNSPSWEGECENGCGPNDWKGVIIGTVLDPVFKESCNRHDRCYCHGYVTYGKGRAQCDKDFLNDMKGDCYDTFCWDILGETFCEPASYGTCISVAGIAYAAVCRDGEEHYIKHGEQTCYDYDNRGVVCPLETVYVDGAFTGSPQEGTVDNPVTTVAAGVGKVAPGGTVIIAAGSYPESLVISKSMTLEASGGSVVIGE
jgi:thiol-disulfide isomerase/thioredoxin